MNCRKTSNLLSAYIDGELPGVEQLQIRDHLKVCSVCCDEYESLLMTKRLLSGMKMREPSVSLEERIRLCIAMESEAPEPVGVAETWRERMEAWWAMLAYSHKLRYSAVFAASSVAVAVIVIIPRMSQKPDPFNLPYDPSMNAGIGSSVNQAGFIPQSEARRPLNYFPTYHNPVENPPPPDGVPALVPVTADVPIGRGR